MTSRILELATQIASHVGIVDRELNEHDLPTPSFDEDGPRELGLGAEAEGCRLGAMEACLELYELLLGPQMLLRPMLNSASLQVIYLYQIPTQVPLNGEIAFEELAQRCNLHTSWLRRILRHAMVFFRVFQEKRPGYVSHSAASRLLAEDPDSMHTLGYMFDEVIHSFGKIANVIPNAQGSPPTATAWNLALQTTKLPWDYYASHPKLSERFNGAMNVLSRGGGTGAEHLVDGYDWGKLAEDRAIVVDVGGSTGATAAAIARRHHNIHLIVQDLPFVVGNDGCEPAFLDGVKDRITFMPHDFFHNQPVKDADAYLLRQIFHNWPEEKGVEILQRLIPALKPGAKVIVNDHLVPDTGTASLMKERLARQMDLQMMSLFGSRDFGAAEWKELFAAASPSFKDVKVWVPQGSRLAIIEATWRPDQ